MFDVQVVVRSGSGAPVLSHPVEEGDIYRLCQTKEAPIRDWVKLAVSRARASGDRSVGYWMWCNPSLVCTGCGVTPR